MTTLAAETPKDSRRFVDVVLRVRELSVLGLLAITELGNIADRILVMHEGRISAEATEESVMAAATGRVSAA